MPHLYDDVRPVSGKAHLHINKLSSTTSPYQLQHAHNPVDWYPWNKEALTKPHTDKSSRSPRRTCLSYNMQLSHPAEMKAVDCKCDRQWEKAWTPEQGPEKKPPVLDAFDTADPQLVNGPPQGQDILRLQLDSDFGRLVLAKECYNARVI